MQLPIESQRHEAIVLVHGAWVGEWSWLPVMPSLLRSRRPIYPVSLTGHGSRRHQAGPNVGLQDHVTDVCSLIETYDLTGVTLVGHSYGGRVITQASARMSDRIDSLVFLDAHAPVAADPGQSPDRIAMAEANGGMLPFTGYSPDPDLLGGQEAVDWFMARTTAQSFKCLTDPWQTELPTDVTKTFVFASADADSRFAAYADALRTDSNWRFHELPGPHFLMMSHPEEVASIILNAKRPQLRNTDTDTDTDEPRKS